MNNRATTKSSGIFSDLAREREDQRFRELEALERRSLATWGESAELFRLRRQRVLRDVRGGE